MSGDRIWSRGIDILAEVGRSARTPEQPGTPEQATPANPATPPPEAPAAAWPLDETDAIPDIGDAYRAHGRVSNKPELMLAFITPDNPLEAFAYGDLRRVRVIRAKEAGGGPILLLRFLEAEITDVTIDGRNLLGLADQILRHRIPWLRGLPPHRTIADPMATVITRIDIRTAAGSSNQA